jgi:O-antigen/teichoic acid export membrane protein
MTRLESILRNTLFSFISRAIDVGVTFALAILLARYLGPEGMGEYTYIIAFVSVFVPLIDLGLDHILIREIAKRRESARTYVGAALLLKLLIILVLLPAGMLAAWLFGDKSVDQWAIFLCFIGTLLLREIPTVVSYAVFLAYERMEFRALVTLFFQIAKFSLTLLVILSKGSMLEIFLAALIGEFVQGVSAIWIMVRKFTRPHLVFDWKLWKYYVVESLPLGIAFAFNSLYFQVDILILKHFRTAEETGLFGVAFRIITTIFTVLVPMIWVLLPHLTRAAKTSIDKLDEHGRGYLKGIAVVTVGISLFLGIEARDLVVNLFGAEYEVSALVLAAIAPVMVLHALTYFFDLTLTATGHQRLIVFGAGSVFFVKLIVDLIFVPIYGVMGAVIGTIAADIAAFAVMYFLTSKYVTGFSLGSIMIRPFWAALTTGVLLWIVRILPFYLSIFIFGLSYLFFIWLFRVVSPDQQQFFREMTDGLMRKFGLTKGESDGADDI